MKHETFLSDIGKEFKPKETVQFDSHILVEYIIRSEEFRDKMSELKKCQDQYQEGK